MPQTGINMQPTPQIQPTNPVSQNTDSNEPSFSITNKKTGEQKTVTVSQAKQMGFDDTFINNKLTSQAALNKTTQTLQEGGDITAQKEGGPLQQFNQNQALTSVLEAEKFFGRGDPNNIAKGKGLSLAGDATRGSKAKAGADAFIKSFTDPGYQQDLNKFDAQMNLVVGALTQLSGSGAPQAAEAERLLKAAPNPTSTADEATSWFSAVKKLGGQKETDTTQTTGSSNNSQQTANVGQTQGGNPPSNGSQQQDLSTSALGAVLGPVGLLTDKRVREGVTPTHIIDFLKNSVADVGKIAGGDTKTRDEYIKQSPLQGLLGPLANPKSRGAAEEGLSYIAGPKILEGAGKAVSSVGELVKSFQPAAKILERAAEMSKVGDVHLSGDNLLSSVENSVKNVSPTQRTAINKFLETAAEDWGGKKFSIQDAVDLLKNANKSYTAAGQAGKAASATFNDALSKSINAELSVVAPEVEAAQQSLRTAYERSGVLGKIFSPTNIGRGIVTGGAITGANKLLGLFGGQ